MEGKRLIEYLPPILAQVWEVEAIMEAAQPEVDSYWAALYQAQDDFFIQDATENGVARWEYNVGLTPKGTETLEERKFRILTRINEQLPYTLVTLRQQLEALCGPEGYSVELKHTAYTLVIKVALTAKHNFDAVAELLARVVPANMVIQQILMYNQHKTLSEYAHAQLTAYTHYELRNEVLRIGNGNP